jgi:hypothetical protein
MIHFSTKAVHKILSKTGPKLQPCDIPKSKEKEGTKEDLVGKRLWDHSVRQSRIMFIQKSMRDFPQALTKIKENRSKLPLCTNRQVTELVTVNFIQQEHSDLGVIHI